MTNFDKIVRWDADFYKSLSDDECIVCLTEKQVYLLGQTIEQMQWFRTRWLGDISGLDFSAIAGELEHRLAERMTCQSLTNILETIDYLSEQILIIYNETTENNGDIVFNVSTTPIDDMTPLSEMAENDYATEACTNADKDKIYGAANQLVRYIHSNNVDLLERISQVGNSISQVSKAITGFLPGTELAPIDEAFGFAQFLVEELLEEYEATVDEELIQATVCDIFCIAVASDCNLRMSDVYNYYASKVSPSFSNVATTYLNLMQYAINGTFSGNDYFYFLSYFQLATVGLKQKFLGNSDLRNYAMQMRAGGNSPDNDWAVFCVDCPTQWRVLEFDFTQDDGGWRHDPCLASTSVMSHIPGIGWQGGGTEPRIGSIVYDAESSWRIRAIGWKGRALDNSALDPTQKNWWFRPTRDSTTGQGNVALSSGTTYPSCREGLNGTGWQQFAISQNASPGKTIVIEKAIIIFYPEAAAPGAIITEDPTTCNRT